MAFKFLDFESPIRDLESKVVDLKLLNEKSNVDLTPEITSIEARVAHLKSEIYSNLSPADTLKIARHPDRPNARWLLNAILTQYTELHGDRLFKDDPAIIGGLGTLAGQNLVFIAHQKGSTTKENIYRNFGMPHPEGYRKALRLMKLAEKFKLPIITLIDTPGAYPGLEAEKRGQAEAIAQNLKYMMTLSVPVVSCVIGEGGSGGALAIGVANKVYMLQHAVYSVISPEGAASILFKDASQASVTAKNLKITAQDNLKYGIIDEIIPEPLGGSQYDPDLMAKRLGETLAQALQDLSKQSAETHQKSRYAKFRKLGVVANTGCHQDNNTDSIKE